MTCLAPSARARKRFTQTVVLTDDDKAFLRGIIVQSGNDACIVAAEGISGGEAQFAAEMNQKSVALGMKGTHFENELQTQQLLINSDSAVLT